MDTEKQMKLIKAGNFKENNGSVLRTINVLRHKFHKLRSIKHVMEDIPEGEILDSVNYLHEAGYIHIRHTLTHEPASLADNDFEELEAKLTAKGISLLAGGVSDPCVIV